MEEFLDLLPEGISATAVIIVVVMFLKHLKDSAKQLNEISTKCHDTQIEVQQGYEQSLARIIEAQGRQTDRICDDIGKATERVMNGVHLMQSGKNK